MASSFILPLADPAAQSAIASGRRRRIWRRCAHAGLPTPGGFCITADAYRRQIQHLGLARCDRGLSGRRSADAAPARGRDQAEALSERSRAGSARRDAERLVGRAKTRGGALVVAGRGSRRIRVSPASSKAFSASATTAEFLTALRACWAALWTTNARRSMAQHDLDPAGTAMAVLVQPLVAARASGGGLSETADGHMLLSATWGLGSAIAQGEVVPDRIVLTRHGFVRTNEAGRKHHREACVHGAGDGRTMPQAVPERTGARALPRSRPSHHARAADAQGGRCARHGGRDRMGARRRGLQASAGAAAPRRSRRMCRTKSGSSIRG